MGIRTKLAIAFLPLLLVAILAATALEIGRTTRVMVQNLRDSGTLVVNQTFEQIRTTLDDNGGDPIANLRQSRGLATVLESAQAFGKGVVYSRIELPDGSLIAGTPILAENSARRPPSLDDLSRQIDSWWPGSWIAPLLNDSIYELSTPVRISDRDLATIRVGLSTGLISSEVRIAIVSILSIGAIAIVLALIVGAVFWSFMLQPVLAFATGIEQIQRTHPELGEMSRQPITHEGLGTLTDRFNELSRQVRVDRTRWDNDRGRFFSIFRSITDAVLLLDGTGKILFANPEAQGRLGLPAGGIADGKSLKLLLGSDHRLARLIDTAYAVGNEVHDVAIELDDRADSARYLVSIFSLGSSPEPPGLLVILRDLGPVKQLESVVHDSGRLARLGALISGVAHQLRIPLNAMTLQLELLGGDTSQDQRIQNRILSVRNEIRRLDQAVEGLMRFLRPEQVRLQRIRLAEFLADVGRRAAHPGIAIEHRLDPRVTEIEVDRALIDEAFRNITANAVEAMPDGGKLTISTAAVSADTVEIRISDEGVGIPPETLNRIFELYFTTKTTGSGLGLPLALRAVDLHGGTLDIDSKVGVGTTVIVRLPISARDLEMVVAEAGARTR
jgi:signal transduction histidine kinase